MDRTKLWELSAKVGGLFKLTVLLQKRIRELVNGAPKLVETSSEDIVHIALMEVEQDKITLDDLSNEELEKQQAEDAGEVLPTKNPLTGNPFRS